MLDVMIVGLGFAIILGIANAIFAIPEAICKYLQKPPSTKKIAVRLVQTNIQRSGGRVTLRQMVDDARQYGVFVLTRGPSPSNWEGKRIFFPKYNDWKNDRLVNVELWDYFGWSDAHRRSISDAFVAVAIFGDVEVGPNDFVAVPISSP